MKMNQKSLPSEKLQKEFEDNPLKILEIIRNEKDRHQEEASILNREINSNESPSSNKLSVSINNEEEKSNNSDDIIKNKDINFSVNKNKINSLNKINYKLFNYNPKSNLDNNRITINNLSIFFSINNYINDRKDYVNENICNNIDYDCINNNICNNRNNNEEVSSTSSQLNEDDKNNIINNNNNTTLKK